MPANADDVRAATPGHPSNPSTSPPGYTDPLPLDDLLAYTTAFAHLPSRVSGQMSDDDLAEVFEVVLARISESLAYALERVA